MDTYIVAVKRQARDRVQDDWADALEDLEGVELVPDAVNSSRRQVRATAEGINAMRQALEETHYIEKVVEHRPSSPGLSRVDP